MHAYNFEDALEMPVYEPVGRLERQHMRLPFMKASSLT